MNRRTARRLRPIVQSAFLLLFLAIAFRTVQQPRPGGLADGLFPFDPLAAIAAMIGGRALIPGMLWAAATLVVTLVLGRVWCGWICPLGTILEYVRFKGASRRATHISPRWRSAKYVLLGVVLVMAAFGSLAALILDPITIVNRAVATALLPLADAGMRGLESLIGRADWLTGAMEWLDTEVRGTVLPQVTPWFVQGIAAGVLLVSILALNLLADRFWCRYLCPLGALLGVLSRVALLRPVTTSSCTSCGRCASACRLGAIERRDQTPLPNRAAAVQEVDQRGAAHSGTEVDAQTGCRPRTAATGMRVVASECIVCLDCLTACPTDHGMRFGRTTTTVPRPAYDPGRRELLASVVLGGAAVALTGAGPWSDKPRSVLRPPGVTDEADFLATCIRCGVCVNVCPTAALQPAGDQAGSAGLWTPVLEPRRGYCDYGCNACGQACPTGAIPNLRLSSKREAVIGVAVIDRTRCLPWSQDTACSVCNEVCPVPGSAIRIGGGRTVVAEDGLEEYITYPTVRSRRCIGCGMCENACPVEGIAAITVQPLAEIDAGGGRGQGRGAGRD